MPSLVRRLTAGFTVLSVLLGALGRALPSCGLGMGDSGVVTGATSASPVAVAHHPGAGGEHRDHCTEDPAGASSQMPSPDQHGVPATGCTWVAHCMTWTPTATELADATSLPPTDAVRAASATLIPLGPDAEPEFPPPRA